ncbi:MAG TPA: hypothetical protein VEK78_00670 [Gemmatimonadales bacterium]|nr:hypothetical protein [Gemmatimonadales bacterium]
MGLRRTLLVFGAVWQAGCYNYLPVRRSSITPTSFLAVTLTDYGSEELARSLGPNALVVRGRYLAPTDQGFALSVESVESRRGDIARWAGETVVVPREFVWDVERRQVSRIKMALLTVAAVVGLRVAYGAFGPASSGGASPSGGTGPSPH